MTTEQLQDLGERFVLQAVQGWGQPEVNRVAAVQAVLDAAGFEAHATCRPVFGRIWPRECTGVDGKVASAWLFNLTDTMQRGHFEDEAAHVVRKLQERRTGGAA